MANNSSTHFHFSSEKSKQVFYASEKIKALVSINTKLFLVQSKCLTIFLLVMSSRQHHTPIGLVPYNNQLKRATKRLPATVYFKTNLSQCCLEKPQTLGCSAHKASILSVIMASAHPTNSSSRRKQPNMTLTLTTEKPFTKKPTQKVCSFF